MPDKAGSREESYGAVSEFGGHRLVTLSPNSSTPPVSVDRTWTVYVLAGHVVCEFQYTGGKNEQIGVQAGQWVEMRRGVAYSLRTRGASVLLMIDEGEDGDTDT